MHTDKWRLEGRPVEEFKKLIKQGHEREQRAIKMFVDYMEREFGKTTEIIDLGCDMSGDYLHKEKVSTDADYMVFGQKVEVKTCSTHTNRIYLKVGQVRSYIRQGASILYVSGIEKDQPKFTLLTLQDLKKMVERVPTVIPEKKINGGKESYLIYEGIHFEWEVL